MSGRGFLMPPRRAPTAGDSERTRQRRALRIEARAKVEAALGTLVAGCEGPFRDEVVAAILSVGADLYAAQKGAASACAGLGAQAGRVGEQLSPPSDAKARAERVFRPGGKR
jgi:hypothetical protein